MRGRRRQRQFRRILMRLVVKRQNSAGRWACGVLGLGLSLIARGQGMATQPQPTEVQVKAPELRPVALPAPPAEVDPRWTNRVMTRYPDGKPHIIAWFIDNRRVRDAELEPSGATVGIVASEGDLATHWQFYSDGATHPLAQMALRGHGQTRAGQREGEWTQWQRDGRRSQRLPYSHGLRDGVQVDEFENGDRVEIIWKQGVSYGPQVRFDAQGRKRAEVPVVDEKKHGLEIQYFASGRRQAEIPWRLGVQQGLAKYFSEDGHILAMVPMVQGLADGEEMHYRTGGTLAVVIPWQHGVREGKGAVFAEDGTKQAETTWQQGEETGPQKRLDSSGRILAVVDVVRGRICCRIRTFYPGSGRLASQRTWQDNGGGGIEVRMHDLPGEITQLTVPVVDGKKDGIAQTFDLQGHLIARLQFRSDVRDGVEERYTPDGGLQSRYTWKADHRVGLGTTFYANGHKQSEFPADDDAGTGLERRWDDGGNLVLTVPLEHGKKQGLARRMDAQGREVATLTFAADMQEGPETHYDHKHKLQFVLLWKAGKIQSAMDGAGKVISLAALMPANEIAELADGAVAAQAEQERAAAEAAQAERRRAEEKARKNAELAKAEAAQPVDAPESQGTAGPVVAADKPERVGKFMETHYKSGVCKSRYPASGNGQEEQFYTNGRRRLEVPIVGGVRNGIAQLFDETGTLLATVPYVHGKRQGLETRFSRTGEKVGEFPYVDDRKTGMAKTFFADGSKQSEFHWSGQGAGSELQYHHNGEVRMMVPLLDGKRHGLATVYTEQGLRWAEQPYVRGKLDGTEVRFDREGRRIRKLIWQQGQLLRESELPEGQAGPPVKP